eukprot:1409108-Prymnesium_polylepis.1
MLGRMYHEEFGRHFSDACGEGVNKFLKRHFEQEFSFEPQKGQVRTRALHAASLVCMSLTSSQPRRAPP